MQFEPFQRKTIQIKQLESVSSAALLGIEIDSNVNQKAGAHTKTNRKGQSNYVRFMLN